MKARYCRTNHPLYFNLNIMFVKKIILSLIFVMVHCYGKSNSIEVILNSKTKTVTRIDLKKEANKLFLKTNFASASIVNPEDLKKIRNNVLLKIELVYTAYRQSESFKQRELNRQRLHSLKKIYPKIFQNDLIEWDIVAQTACVSAEEGRDMFHGFIITFRPTLTKEDTEKEMSFLKEALGLKGVPILVEKGKESYSEEVEVKSIEEIPTYDGGDVSMQAYISRSLKYPVEAIVKGIQGTVFVTFVVTETGSVTEIKLLKGIGGGCDEVAMNLVANMPKWKPGKQKGVPVNSRFNLPVRFTLDGESRSDIMLYDPKTTIETGASAVFSFPNYFVSDSAVIKTLNRNRKWKNMLVICDFTGSMSPYTSQLLVWHKLNLQTKSSGIKYFTFFNDGDSKSTGAKIIGATGGIYSLESANFDEVAKLALTTMSKGNGGDTPENNIEAVLKGIEDCPDCEEIIMIGDNFATPRDLSLLSEVKKPIRLILCGTFAGINTAYLDMVRSNKGSLHTMEEDIINLMGLNEGSEIAIGGKLYKIEKGQFVSIIKI